MYNQRYIQLGLHFLTYEDLEGASPTESLQVEVLTSGSELAAFSDLTVTLLSRGPCKDLVYSDRKTLQFPI
jgi:hypothetical protein